MQKSSMMYTHLTDHLQSLREKVLAQKITSRLGYGLIKKEGRTDAFKAEAVLRLLVKMDCFSDDEVQILALWLRDVKSIEDALGQMDECLHFQKELRIKRASRQKIKDLEQKAALVSRFIQEMVLQMDWLGSRESSFLQELLFVKNIDPKTEMKSFTKALAGYLKFTDRRIKKELLPALKKKKFGPKSVEKYFHDFRRKMRWLAIYLQEFKECFFLSSETPQSLTKNHSDLFKKYKKNPYTQLSKEKTLFEVDRFSFYLLTDFIYRAGDLKDQAEFHFNLLSEKLPSDLPEKKTKRQMMAMMDDYLGFKIAKRLVKLNELLGE